MILLATLLIVSTALAGAFAGILFPQTMLLRGALFGGILGAVLLVLACWSRQRLDAGKGPSLARLIGVAAGGGLVAGLFLLLPAPATSGTAITLHPPVEVGWLATILLAMGYSLAFHLVYALRWRAPLVGRTLPLLLAVVGMVVAAIRHLLVNGFGDPESTLFFALVTGVPFGIAWGTAVAWFDPAFSISRWRRVRKGGVTAKNAESAKRGQGSDESDKSDESDGRRRAVGDTPA